MTPDDLSSADVDSELTTLPEITLRPVLNDKDIALTQEIFTEYIGSLGLDLSFQGLEEELSDLKRHYYLPEEGLILLAFVEGVLAGCAALRPLADCDYIHACEMKRLYVRPAFRGFGIDLQLSESLLEYAKTAGYATLLLDTVDEMESVYDLYKSLDFEEIPPYYYNPLPGAHFLKVELA